MKVVVDEGVPRQLVTALRQAGLDAHRFPKKWEQTKNGVLIAAIEAEGFAVLITNDKNIAYQQSLRGRNVAVVGLPLNRRADVVARVQDIVDTVRRAKPGQHVIMDMDGTRRARSLVAGVPVEEELPSVPTFKS